MKTFKKLLTLSLLTSSISMSLCGMDGPRVGPSSAQAPTIRSIIVREEREPNVEEILKTHHEALCTLSEEAIINCIETFLLGRMTPHAFSFSNGYSCCAKDTQELMNPPARAAC